MGNNVSPEIDKERCTACGACVTACPDRILVPDRNDTGIVSADYCMGCGHCFAVCPVGAVTVSGLDFTLGLKTVSTDSDRDISEPVPIDQLVRLMRLRRSCRSFKNAPPKLDMLTDLVRIGSTAPSATNSQGWQFAILPTRSEVVALGELTAVFYSKLNRKAANPLYRLIARLFAGDRLDRYYRQYYHTIERGLSDWYNNDRDLLFHGAPSAIIVAGDDSSSCPKEDALLATQNILLAAESMGLATCLIGFVVEAAKRDRRIALSLGFAATERIYSVISCGYSSMLFHRFAGRKVVTPRIISSDRDLTVNNFENKQ